MRTAVTRVNGAYQRKIKTQFRKQKGIIHKYTEEIHKIQNTMVTIYLQEKQKNGIYWLYVMELLFIIFKK